ncbi:CHAP domain-containing protein [Nocardia sp. NPDC051463]|uniref:CHAP domain-containing protein n=1 Tax=Nocardia sp. NPDC051463 TaxID=3154845 RepID=UPI00344E9F0E
MAEQRTVRRGPGYGWLVLGLVVSALVACGVVGVRRLLERGDREAIVGVAVQTFPAIDESTLDPTQATVVAVLEREFGNPGDGPKYAEGNNEPWCADFVSWVMRESVVPLANPNSGSWRIPGVNTLQEYYQSTGRFTPIAAGYQPRTGDVLLYGPASPFSQHTNIVLTAADGVVTTMGGNEFGEIRMHRFDLAEVPDIVGFGML